MVAGDIKNSRWSWCAVALVLFALASAGPASAAQGGEELTYTFTFDSPVLNAIDAGGASYFSLLMPGAITLGHEAGEPAMPVRFVKILLPPGRALAGVEVTGTPREFAPDGADLQQRPVFPYQHPVPIGNPPPKELALNKAIYASKEPFPAEPFGGVEVGYSHGYAILSLGLSPVQYVPGGGKLAWYPEMKVIVRTEPAPANPLFRGMKSDREWVSHLVCNPEIAALYHERAGGPDEYPGGLCDPSEHYDYVIVTTTQNGLDYWMPSGSTPYNWQSLMDRHTANDGLACKLVTIQDILAETAYQNPDPLFNDTPARIREFCKDAYQDWGTQYVLVGGDHEWIPAREMDSSVEYNVCADIYWSNLDNTFNADHDSYWGEEGDSGFDMYAELFIGRLPCDEPKDVSNWLTKLFRYADEQDPDVLDNAAFYGGDTTWPCQGDDFIDYSAIQGLDHWLGPDPSADPPYPSWLGFQYGFETWNQENPGVPYDLSVKWTAEPTNPGWSGGSSSSAINGLKNAINNNQVTLISGIAHADPNMSLDVYYNDWEANYHNTKPFFIHDYGCHCGDMHTSDGVLHSMLFHSDTELAFACVYNTGYGWGAFYNTGSSSAVQQKSFWDYCFDLVNNSGSCENWQMAKAQAFSKDLMAPTLSWSDGSWRETIQCCLLFGDPAQRIKPAQDPILFMSFPQGVPGGAQPPGLAMELSIQIKDGKENYVPGSGLLHYRFSPDNPYTEVPLVSAGGNLYTATLPTTAPGDAPEFYFSAEGDGGSTIYAPWNAPTQVYHYDICLSLTLFHDNFENNLGWSVVSINLTDGEWVRNRPFGGGYHGEPLTDGDGSGKCYITGNVVNSDVDGGPTNLVSPVIDLSSGDAEVSFDYWFYDSNHNDTFRIWISNNDGVKWERVEDIPETNGWSSYSFMVSDYILPTSKVKVEFMAVDNPDDSTYEAAVDAFHVRRVLYDPSLYADAYSLSAGTGGSVGFTLDAGASHANRKYLLLGSITGVQPGFPLPGGMVLPLNWDVVTDLILSLAGSPVCQGFLGQLDASGHSTAVFNTFGPLDPMFIGYTLDFAYLLGSPFDYVSNAMGVDFVP